LGARLDGIEEVVGSNPIGSTITYSSRRVIARFPLKTRPTTSAWAAVSAHRLRSVRHHRGSHRPDQSRQASRPNQRSR